MNLQTILPFVFPVVVIIAVIAAAASAHKQAAVSAPPMEIWARVVRIRPSKSGDTLCDVTFADAAEQKFTLQAAAVSCDSLREGAVGSLCYQGTRFISFQ